LAGNFHVASRADRIIHMKDGRIHREQMNDKKVASQH